MNTQNNILPIQVTEKLDEAVSVITTIHIELWDESTNYLIESLKKKAEEKRQHHIFGMKFIADVQEHISMCEKQSAYRVIRQDN